MIKDVEKSRHVMERRREELTRNGETERRVDKRKVHFGQRCREEWTKIRSIRDGGKLKRE